MAVVVLQGLVVTTRQRNRIQAASLWDNTTDPEGHQCELKQEESALGYWELEFPIYIIYSQLLLPQTNNKHDKESKKRKRKLFIVFLLCLSKLLSNSRHVLFRFLLSFYKHTCRYNVMFNTCHLAPEGIMKSCNIRVAQNWKKQNGKDCCFCSGSF